MKSYRCSACSHNYPPDDTYKVCPLCEDECWSSDNIDPMDAAEARSLKNHADFERFCAERDAAFQGHWPDEQIA